ncbi:PAS domain S-box protein, partial [Flavobacterium sp.]|uniref:PAS domain S-box protein n=1 Tax=Flavobacterium sp. TaxID=239 RepID=UPI002BF8EB16
MINKFKASLELTFFAFVLSILAICVGAYAVREISTLNKGSEELYQDRMIPVQQMVKMRRAISDVFIITNMRSQEQMVLLKASDNLKKNLEDIIIDWEKYKNTNLTITEKTKISETEVALDKYSQTVNKLILCLERNDFKTFNSIRQSELNINTQALSNEIYDLIFFQTNESKNIFVSNSKVYEASKQKFTYLLLIVLIFSVPYLIYLLKKNYTIIRDRNRFDKKLVETESKYHSLFEQAGDAILVIDENSNIRMANTSACQLLGYSKEEFLSMDSSDICPWVSMRLLQQDIDLIKRGDTLIDETKLQTKDGAIIEVEINRKKYEGDHYIAIIRDITERKKSEKLIKESEEKYRYLFDNNPGHIIIWDPETLKVLEVNNTVLNNHGYSKEDWDNMTVLDNRPTEVHYKTMDFVEIINNSEETVFDTNGRYLKKNGEEMFMNVTSHKILYNSQKAMLSIGHEITEQVKAENELRQSEDKYRYLFDNSPIYAIVWDIENLEVLEVNNTVLNKYGYSKEEWEKMSLLDYRPKEEHQRIKDYIQFAVNVDQTVFNGNWKHVMKNGEEIDMNVFSHKIVYNNRNAILSLSTDITERLKAEKELKQSEERYRLLTENITDAIVLFNEKLEIIYQSPVAERISGYSFEEKKGKILLDFFHPDDLENAIHFLASVNSLTKVSTEQQFRLIGKEGQVVWVEGTVINLLDNKNVGCYMVNYRDITDRKRIEAELIENKELLKLFVEHSPVSLAMFDNDMRYIASSNKWLEDYSIKESIIGKNHYELFPEIPQRWKDVHQRCLKGATEKSDDDVIIRADGKAEWQRWEIHPWHKATGEIGGIMMFIELTTEKKQATEMFRHLYENSPDTILYVNRDFIIENINKNIINDTPAKEFIGKNCVEILAEKDQSFISEQLNRCFDNGEKIEFEFEIKENVWGGVRMIPSFLDSDEVTHVMIFHTDITNRRQANQKLAESEERYRIVTESITDAIILFNKDLQIIYKSPVAEKISNFSADESKNKNLLDFFHPDDQEKAKQFLASTSKSNKISKESEYRIIGKEGQIIWIEGTVINLIENKSIGGYMVNYRDITERKKLEEQQALMSSIVKSSEEAIVSNTIDGIISSWNAGAERVLGYTAEEAIGKHFSMLIPENEYYDENEIINTIKKGSSIDYLET